MKKVHITRKNIITLSITFLWLALFLIVSACVDADSGIFSSKNPIHKMVVDAFNLPSIDAMFNAWILVILFAVYVFIFTASFIYEMRLAQYYDGKKLSVKYVFIYIFTFVVCVILWLGISMVCQIPSLEVDNIVQCFVFLGESCLATAIIGIPLFAFIYSICALYVNFKNIDKPYRYFNPDNFEDFIAEDEAEAEEEAKKEGQGELPNIFGLGDNQEIPSMGMPGNGVQNSDLGATEYVFPALTTIDGNELFHGETNVVDAKLYKLDDICNRFRNYLAIEEKIYFDISIVREFIAGLAASRLIILEGLSGTGKSSLARYFSDFIGQESFFSAVQASWRDRTALLGFYNDFSKRYNETPFLQRLYLMSYQPESINIMVLDEMNIARIEYYFADFLSIMEYPKEKWILPIMQLPHDFEPPSHLVGGELHIPENTWFIGTANKDDSTYTITDKVYDRAITISFDGRNKAFQAEGDHSAINLTYHELVEMFEDAKHSVGCQMNEADFERFGTITKFVSDTFDITFGNRILNQIENFVPVYVACGGTKEDALDFLFSRKIIAKLDGRFEEYVKEGLNSLISLLDQTYGANSFELTRREIRKFLRKL